MAEQRLRQCLVLALLLHVWLVLMLGNTPGGQARPGEGAWGSLSVRLRWDEPQARSGPPAPPVPDNGPQGEAKSRRFGGAVRAESDAAARAPEPGAARLGLWQARDAQQAVQPLGDVAPLSSTEPAAVSNGLSSPQSVGRVPDSLQPLSSAAGSDDASAAAVLPPLSAALPAAPTVPRRLEPPPAAVERLATPALSAIDATAAAAALAPAPRLRLPTPSTPALERTGPLPAVSELVEAVPGLSLPTVQRSSLPEPAAISRRAPTAPLAPAAAKAESPPEVAALPAAPRQPTPIERPIEKLSDSAAVSANATELQPLPSAPAMPATSAIPPPASALPLLPPPPRLPVAAGPDAGAQLGHDVATPPSASASAPPAKLNLSLPRAGEVSVRSSRGVLQLLPHPPERKSKLGESIEGAARADCRDAHRDSGLVGAAAIAADALRGKGCRW
ncbi:hypothetical protein [Roseateles sp.]|uniref:hypothetical protein n=1 Tax=Roseateles sp. TaxID=1971397 RepID=UPI0037C66A46